MSKQKDKTFNSQVYKMACKRLKLKRREKIIFYRLLGFLIRNDKPFPFSSNAMSELTGYARSSVFECFNFLEHLRLIDRIGYTNQAKFMKGRMLIRICSLVQKRIIIELNKNHTLVQKPDKFIPTSPETGYKKTSSSLKHKEGDLFSLEQKQTYQEYVGKLKSDVFLGLKSKETKIMTIQQWSDTIKT